MSASISATSSSAPSTATAAIKYRAEPGGRLGGPDATERRGGPSVPTSQPSAAPRARCRTVRPEERRQGDEGDPRPARCPLAREPPFQPHTLNHVTRTRQGSRRNSVEPERRCARGAGSRSCRCRSRSVPPGEADHHTAIAGATWAGNDPRTGGVDERRREPEETPSPQQHGGRRDGTVPIVNPSSRLQPAQRSLDAGRRKPTRSRACRRAAADQEPVTVPARPPSQGAAATGVRRSRCSPMRWNGSATTAVGAPAAVRGPQGASTHSRPASPRPLRPPPSSSVAARSPRTRRPA